MLPKVNADYEDTFSSTFVPAAAIDFAKLTWKLSLWKDHTDTRISCNV